MSDEQPSDESVEPIDPTPPNRYQVILWEGLMSPLRGSDGIFEYGTCFDIEKDLERTVDTERETNTIDVWLQSGGGSADEAYRYMLLFREYAEVVRVVVGRHAKSAATLMLIGADQIYMGAGSELGPLDAQVYSDELDRRISALDIARSIESLMSTAIDLALTSGGVLVDVTGIPRREVLPSILHFTSEFLQPMVAKMEPAAVYRASNQLRIASDYALRLIAAREGRDADADERRLVNRLVNDYPDHGFLISKQEARDLGLPVLPASGYVDFEAFRHITSRLDESGVTAIVLKDLLGEVDDEDDDADAGADADAVENRHTEPDEPGTIAPDGAVVGPVSTINGNPHEQPAADAQNDA